MVDTRPGTCEPTRPAASPVDFRNDGKLSARRQQLTQRLGKRKVNVLFPNQGLLNRRPVVAHKVIDALLNNILGSRGTGGDQNAFHPLKPAFLDLGDTVD